MTGEQSRALKVGDSVQWDSSVCLTVSQWRAPPMVAAKQQFPLVR
jgi:hypothetical protein